MKQPLPNPERRSSFWLLSSDGFDPSLVRRHLEEEITRLVNLPPSFLSRLIGDFCGDQDQDTLLNEKGWTEA